MTTFLMESEGRSPTTVPELDEILAEVCTETGEDWRILERPVRVRRRGFLWRRREVTYCYQLLFGIGGGQYQVINFWRPWSGEWSINDLVPAELVVAYLYGVHTGVWSCDGARR